MQTLTVALGRRSYPIYIGSDLLDNQALLKRHIVGKQLLIVSNETVAPYYLGKLQLAFVDYQCDHLLLPDGEQHKTLKTASKIFDHLLENNHHRDTTIVAFDDSVSAGIYYDSNEQDESRAEQLAERFRKYLPALLEEYDWADDISVLVSVYSEDDARGH